jgi:hypothetical protein
MREYWTEDSRKILKTIGKLIKANTPMHLYQKGVPPLTVYAREVIHKQKGSLLLLFKPGSSKVKKEKCFISFQPKGQPLYGFEGVPLLESEQHVAIPFPEAIYRVQRRKHARVETPGNSKAVFTFRNRRRIYNCQVLDFSMRGARLLGKVFGEVKKGGVIEPISFSLCSRYSDTEERINIPEATVTRMVERKDDETELGIFFKVPPDNVELADAVELYIQMRMIEDDSF